MARKLELKMTTFDAANGGKELSYGDLMLIILRSPAPGRGVSLDEMLTALDAIEPIEAAVSKQRATVTLTDEQWKTLRGKLDQFAFAFVDFEIARFGKHIREAPEIGVANLDEARAD